MTDELASRPAGQLGLRVPKDLPQLILIDRIAYVGMLDCVTAGPRQGMRVSTGPA
jgi:hypothetical protein